MNIPGFLTRQQWTKREQATPWLRLTDAGAFLCSICIDAGKISTDKSGMFTRNVWTTEGVVCPGKDDVAKKQSLRTKINAHSSTKAHQAAVKVLSQAQKDVLPELFLQQNSKFEETTCRLMRTAYYLAKNNRPYTAYEDLCELQESNGIYLGIGLHSRFSATGMVDCIADYMRKKLCSEIKQANQKISIMMDESTTVSRKSCLLLYMRTAWPALPSNECFSFPVGLVELDSLTADHITETVLQTLNSLGFDNQYLAQHLIGACSDGASVMLGKNSGVLTQLKNHFPNIFLWHCMCHRIELAIGDAVKSVTQINHVKSMLDKLYSIYSQSPKAQRELETCAAAVGAELKKIGRVLGVRWVASSYQALSAVWSSYAALYAHSCSSDSAMSKKHQASYSGIKNALASKELLHSLAVMLDALKEVSTLSKTLQGDNCSLSDAYRLLKRTIRALKSQKDGHGDFFQEYMTCEQSGEFRGIKLSSKGKFLNKESFIQALIDNLSSRLNENVSISGSSGLSDLLSEFDVLDKSKWPSGLEAPWVIGENRLKSLCNRFSLEFSDYQEAFRDFVDDLTQVPLKITRLQSIVNTLPISSADCERGFSCMNVICNKVRNTLTVKHTSNLMLISLVGPPVCAFKPECYVKMWLKSHRSAEDTRTRIAKPSYSTRYSKVWKLF